ncbi:hypothetical protein Tco_1370040 [Tanacetum coccineum]
MRVSYQVDVRSRESLKFYSRHHDVQKDRAAVRAEIEVLRKERLSYEQESMETCQALARSEAYCRALEVRVTVLETEVHRHEWQHQAADDFAVRHIMRTQALEAGARVDTWRDNDRYALLLLVAIRAMINEGVTTALAARDATRNGDDSHTSGMGARRPVQVARECTYPDFLKCQPLNFKGMRGVVGSLSGKCSLHGGTPMLSPLLLSCPCNDMEVTEKDNEDKYCQGAKLRTRVRNGNLKVEKYVSGLPDMIHGSVMATKPKTMQDAIEFATELMDKKIGTFAERQAENKRKLDNNNQAQQQLPKRQNVVQAYTAGIGERKEYDGTLPMCNKCKFHHNGPCIVKCANCKRVSHLTRDCWSYAATNNQRTLTCYECGNHAAL